MSGTWHRFRAQVRRIFRLVILFCVLRFAVGISAIALFDRGAIAWGPELTVVILASIAVYAAVGLAVRYGTRPDSRA